MDFAVINRPVRAIKLTVEQIVAIRAMLKLELVGKLNEITKSSLFDVYNKEAKISDVSATTSAELLETIEHFEALDHPFVSALGPPFSDSLLDKYALDRVYEVVFIQSDFNVIAEIVEKGLYAEFIEFAFEREEDEDDSFHSFLPTLVMARNRGPLIKLFKEEPPKVEGNGQVAYSMPPPKGGLKN
jgi:hypothetical protein